MKKGFTLVELLAVLVVLAVIAVIAFPTVVTMIGKSKSGAFKSSGIGIIDAAKQAYVTEVGKEMRVDVSNNKIMINNVDSLKELKYKGEKPTGGYVLITAEGDISLAIYNTAYCAYKQPYDQEVEVKKINSPSECTLDEISD